MELGFFRLDIIGTALLLLQKQTMPLFSALVNSSSASEQENATGIVRLGCLSQLEVALCQRAWFTLYTAT